VEAVRARQSYLVEDWPAGLCVNDTQKRLIALREIEAITEQHWRRHVRRSATQLPKDCGRLGQVAGAAESDRPSGRVRVAAHEIDAVAVRDWGRDRVDPDAAALPDFLAGGKIVAADSVITIDDDLGAATMLDHERCVPGAPLLPGGAPAVLPGRGVETDE